MFESDKIMFEIYRDKHYNEKYHVVYYTELNDQSGQRLRFDVGAKQAEAGSEVAQPKDEEFLEALEHGMPPAAGMGIGIDRFAAILAGVPSLKEIILYPTLRPKQ